MSLTPLYVAGVVIGRNEGELLKRSLASVQAAGLPMVYVDSGSTDGSLVTAREFGVAIVELDPLRPFSAARARNEGCHEVQRRWPHIKYVMFLDGDCELEPGFPFAAAATFGEKAECAIVTGHLLERQPYVSIYNRLCAIEWRSPVGQIKDMRIGGIIAARISAFLRVGGFNDDIIAGEEPDLAARLCCMGYSIFKIDVPMAVHDADMLTFGQWWARAVRGGKGIAQLFERHRRTGYQMGARELRSAGMWGFALPILTAGLLWPTRGVSFLLIGTYGLLGRRVYKHYRATNLSRSDAWLMTRFIIYSKFAECIGIFRYWATKLTGRLRIIKRN